MKVFDVEGTFVALGPKNVFHTIRIPFLNKKSNDLFDLCATYLKKVHDQKRSKVEIHQIDERK